MDPNQHLRQTLEYYRQQRQQKLNEMRPQLEQLRSLELMIRQLERELGEASTSEIPEIPVALSDGLTFTDSVTTNKQPAIAIRPDEFYTMTQSDAAKAYLRKVGHAISFDELVAALRKGGARLGGADPKKTLYVSLARNPRKEFVWPSSDHIGLSEFYGGRARLDGVPGSREKKRKDRKRGSGKRGRPPKAHKNSGNVQSSAKPENKLSDVALALHEVMKDGRARSREDIFKEVQARIGHPIEEKMAVIGALNSKKKYQRVDGQYRAIQ